MALCYSENDNNHLISDIQSVVTFPLFLYRYISMAVTLFKILIISLSITTDSIHLIVFFIGSRHQQTSSPLTKTTSQPASSNVVPHLCLDGRK